MKHCMADKSLIVVFVLGIALLVMVVGGGLMNYHGREIDERFYEILNLIVLGLVALLKTGNSGSEPTPVIVENTPSDAVPTVQQKPE